MTKKAPMRWRKVRQEGFKPSFQFELWQSGRRLAVVAPLSPGLWFSYGLEVKEGWNTSMSPVRDLDEAKADVIRRIKPLTKGCEMRAQG